MCVLACLLLSYFVSLFCSLFCGFLLLVLVFCFFFFFSSRRRHTRSLCDWSSDVCSSDLFRRQFLHLRVGVVGGPQRRPGDEGTGGEKRLRAGRCRRRQDGELHERARARRSEERRVGKEGRSRGGEER